MSRPRKNYFIVKHDLRSFLALPGRVWNSEQPSDKPPVGFKTIHPGDKWIAFAYTSSDRREKKVSVVTGFYECVANAKHGELTQRAAHESGQRKAWMISGREHGAALRAPVAIPPLQTFIRRPLFHRRTITRITREDYDRIRRYVRAHAFDPTRIACLRREPTNEQEVLAVAVAHQAQLGIQKFLRVQTRYPDTLVKLKGRARPVYLELEFYSSSFLAHGHQRHTRARCCKQDGIPVGVLCWIDDAPSKTLGPIVHRVFALRDLIRDREPLRW
jgi:hypothetical protein